jgi:hypothetical protein
VKPHHWSGWPGAYCLDCFSDDENEIALANEPDYLDNPTDRNGPCPGPYNIYCGQCLTADTTEWYDTKS